jgi:hypothetical protein
LHDRNWAPAAIEFFDAVVVGQNVTAGRRQIAVPDGFAFSAFIGNDEIVCATAGDAATIFVRNATFSEISQAMEND